MSEHERDQGVDEQPERNEASAPEIKNEQRQLDDGPPDIRDMSISAKQETSNAKKETSSARRENSFTAGLKSWSSRLGAVARKRYTTITLTVATAIALAVVGYLVFGRSSILSTPTKTVPSASTQTAQTDKGSKAGPFSVFESQP